MLTTQRQEILTGLAFKTNTILFSIKIYSENTGIVDHNVFIKFLDTVSSPRVIQVFRWLESYIQAIFLNANIIEILAKNVTSSHLFPVVSLAQLPFIPNSSLLLKSTVQNFIYSRIVVNSYERYESTYNAPRINTLLASIRQFCYPPVTSSKIEIIHISTSCKNSMAHLDPYGHFKPPQRTNIIDVNNE